MQTTLSGDFIIKPIKQNYDARIKVSPRIVQARSIQTKDALVLFYAVNDFGIFNRYVAPIIIGFNSELPDYLKLIKGGKVISQKLIQKENALELVFSNSINDVYKIRLIAFPKQLPGIT